MTERGRNHASAGSTARPSDIGAWSLLLVPITVCLALLLFVALQPSTASSRVSESEPSPVRCNPGSPDTVVDPRC